MTDTPPPRAGWLQLVLSARDNLTPAIGRVIGAALTAVVLGLILNAMVSIDAAPTAVEGKARADNWGDLFRSLEYFVPAMAAAIGGLIAGTNFTEPKPKPRQPDNDGKTNAEGKTNG